MMERDFINRKTQELHIKKYVEKRLNRVELSSIQLKKIPLGEKIIITTSRPSLVVGSKGVNIRDLTKELKKQFNLENPQIEIVEVKDPFLDPNVIADRIVSLLERYGSQRFKSVGHKMMENVIRSGGLGVEIIISGKIPGARAKSWRFYQGYLKKCGDVAVEGIYSTEKSAKLKSGIIGVKVKIMPPETRLPDRIIIKETPVSAAVSIPQSALPAAEAQPEEEKSAEPTLALLKKKGKETAEKKERAPRKRTVKKTVTVEEPAPAEEAAAPAAEEAAEESAP